MRKSLLLFTTAILLISISSNAQQADRFAYAVTDAQQMGANWSFLRKLNLQTGEYSSILLSGNDASFLAYNASSKKQLSAPLTDSRYGQSINAAFGSGVAAIAYDRKNNRLYYTPMLFDQLRYIDLKNMKVFYVTDKVFTGKSIKNADQGNIVTRMAIASDGNGYALTNDATQLIRFSTAKNLKIEDLGSVVDDPANKNVSIHNSCSSFGGDMIADDNGNLFVISARNNVFKVNIESKVATHLGTITGLPQGFTVNGAAVTEDNQVVVSSAMQTAYYTVDYRTWTASPYAVNSTAWNSSDLANSNLLATAVKNNNAVTEVMSRNTIPNSGNGKIGIYPNPVANNQFVIQFTQLEPGNYSVQVTDVMGRQVIQQSVSLSGDSHAQVVKLNPSSAKGIYLVKVNDQNSRSVFSTKLVVQ